MARTIVQIYDSMIAEKQTMIALNTLQPSIDSSQTFLADLTSSSKVAAWRTMLFVMAVAIWTVEKLFDEHRVWIEARALELIVGTPSWYAQRALEFQYGETLVFVDGKYQYSAVNLAIRLVKLVSVNEINGQVYMKIAKLTGTNPVALTIPELAAFDAYMKKIKFAGVIVNTLSRPADLLRIQYHVYVDPLLMNINGELISNSTIKPVEDAINNYCKSLPFNGVFAITALTDKIQASAGVVNPVFENASAQYGLNPFVGINDYYNPNAGYLTIDPTFTLATSIVYILQP